MLNTKAVTVDSVRAGDIILLNDRKSLAVFGTFYLECYTATSEGSEVSTELQAAQVLEISKIADTYRIQVRTYDNRVLDLDLNPWQQLSVFIPEMIEVGRLRVDDEILLRGDYSPAHRKRGYEFALIERRYGSASKIVKIKKNWRGVYKLTVMFGGVKKLKLIVDPGVRFETDYISGD